MKLYEEIDKELGINFYGNDFIEWEDYSIPEEILDKHSSELSKLDWYYISQYQRLSEQFIEKYDTLLD